MSNGNQSSPFKYVFWGLLFLMFLAFGAQATWLFFGGLRSIPHLFGFREFGPHIWGPHFFNPRFIATSVPMILLTFFYVLIVATVVYKDAKKRGLDPWLWATVATFVPFFLGIVVYLVVRSNGRTTCVNCGEPIRSEYRVCPYCGHGRKRLCPQCSRPVAPEWKICPYCEKRLVAQEGE